jgi:hypothetical protein
MKHKCGHFIMENTFGILKHPFQKLLEIFEIHITIILDVFTCYCLLHILICDQMEINIDQLMEIIIHKVQYLPRPLDLLERSGNHNKRFYYWTYHEKLQRHEQPRYQLKVKLGNTWNVNTICLGKIYMHHHFAIQSQKSVMGKVIEITYLNCMMN